MLDSNIVNRFWSKVEVKGPDDCWLWTAATQKGGYGAFKINSNRRIGAHRLSLIIFDPSKEEQSKYACHTCDNPPCVNPKHLFWGTAQHNNKDAVSKNRWSGGNALKTHCKHGHEFNEENTLLRKKGAGRTCRACARNRAKARLDKQVVS